MRLGAIFEIGRWVPNRRVFALVGASLSCVALFLGGVGALIVPVLFALAASMLLLHDERRTQGLASRLGGAAQSRWFRSAWTGLSDAVAELETRARGFESRLPQRHGVTGLPTREPLLTRMEQDKRGTLSVIAFADFDRLCAFDPDLADRGLRILAERVARMIGEDRLFAHVDRSHFALWFGPALAADEAEQQLTAIGYALNEPLDRAFGLVAPPRVHHARFDCADDSPQAALARLLAASGSIAAGAPQIQRIDHETGEAERSRYALEQDLRGALSRGEFELRFQPQIDVAQRRACGAEALLRWNCPTRGMVSPALFIPLLEQFGLIDEVGLWVLNASCRQARHWRALGLGAMTVAVNVSARQLESSDFPMRIHRTLAAHALPPKALELELTESQAAGDLERANHVFAGLRDRGVSIAIDDFGTGFSSFSALRTLGFDKIKIDREFVTDVEQRRDSQAICQSMIALARGLGVRVLAEGVERREEYAWLRQHGCHEFQGYYFARPLDAAGFVAFVGDAPTLGAALEIDARHGQQLLAQRFAP
ncbi:putative bifunctional diguanylate cyclase/phosphodiesterase [Sphingomonas sp. MMS12-HWE2-04]|uniref:putative bifunctional diguanylate cyclase/phosphodiesterase n=1 Tax=Sphingomonas sp. MMS12-HWE2-04 TaxID=3234199 RepID=UPI00384E4FD9